MTQPQDVNWPAWITAMLGGAAAAYAIIKRFLATVTRDELRQSNIDENTANELRHAENIGRFDEVFERIGKIEQALYRLQGELSGRYRRPTP